MKFKYNNIPVRIKGLKVYCKDPLVKWLISTGLQTTYSFVDDQQINPLNIFIARLQEAGDITDVEYEKGDDDDENFIIH